MLSNASQIDSLLGPISHSVTLAPRLTHCIGLLDKIIDRLEKNMPPIRTLDLNTHDLNYKSVDLEQTVMFSFETLLLVRERVRRVSQINMIPEMLSPLVSVIRTVSAKLHKIDPKCCQDLSVLSIHMGSVVFDSAALTKARFDFAQLSIESSDVMNMIQLMADSKVNAN